MIFQKPSKSDIVKIRKILMRMRYHDSVRYSGPIYMLNPYVYMGEDYEFHDKDYGDWDSDRAYMSKSPPHKQMKEIIKILEKNQVDIGFTLTKHTLKLGSFR